MSMIKEKVLCRKHYGVAIGRLMTMLLVLMMASPSLVRAQGLFGDNWNDPLNPGPSILPDFDVPDEDTSEWEYRELKTYSFSGGDGTEKIRI